jgi:hypothetical protein
MHRGTIGLLVLLALALSAVPVNSAQTEWQIQQTTKFENEPLDMVVAARSRRVYILNNLGEILIHSLDGQFKGKIKVGTDVSRIKMGANEDLLFLLKRNRKTIQAITISVAENIKLQGAPYKGEPSAPVAIAVFSDFQ